jgi:hypothetical protein
MSRSQRQCWLILWLTLGLGFCGGGKKDVERITIDGVAHVRNPAKPLRGTIILNVEKTLEIDPYRLPDVGLKYVAFARDVDGEVILFDPNSSEAHRFSDRGEYLGRLSQKGQGPGEFPEYSGFSVSFVGAEIRRALGRTDVQTTAGSLCPGKCFLRDAEAKKSGKIIPENSIDRSFEYREPD